MNLELKHLAPYLPYDVKVIDTNNCIYTIHPYKDALDCLSDNEHVSLENFFDENNSAKKITHKLLLRQLSNYADVNSKEMNDLNCDLLTQIQISEFASKKVSICDISVSVYNLCLSNHIDVFDLIAKGLALPLI